MADRDLTGFVMATVAFNRPLTAGLMQQGLVEFYGIAGMSLTTLGSCNTSVVYALM